MLSYRHAFHAGNHADVLKHFVLSLVLDYFNQKEKPYWVIDTHAGAGIYALEDAYAQKNAEFQSGVARLNSAKNLPNALNLYLNAVQSINANKTLKLYPGSPQIAMHHMREQDKLRLFELHPSDFQRLQQHFKPNGRQVKADMADGFDGIKACLPPATKRGVILIDPPYELKEDYLRVVSCIEDSLKRFATGTYMIWYPLLQRPEPNDMLKRLHALKLQDWLDVQLIVQTPRADGMGMYGSGMFVINPPWQLPAILNEVMPTMTQLLGQDSSAKFNLDYAIT
ncbi:MAG: 23S rRNA (adenine(2030)-N(6))-methyltransferase RlmJ [Methylophilus sp.]|nr:23S rRNA (adenine(2030)-N(6))-methyltransferase RlmJ [Methylophilus sp.]